MHHDGWHRIYGIERVILHTKIQGLGAACSHKRAHTMSENVILYLLHGAT